MKIGELASLFMLSAIICISISGCNEGKNPSQGTESLRKEESTVDNAAEETSFDPTVTIFERTQENIRMDAKVSIPDAAKEGHVTCAMGSPLPLKEDVEKLKNVFSLDSSSLCFMENEMDKRFFSLESVNVEDDWKALGYNDTAGFVINSQEYSYCKNCIVTEAFVDAFNGDEYQKIENLDFMSQQDAISTVRSIFKDFGIFLGEVVDVYVMDYETMQQQEDATDIDGNYDPSIKKSSWSSEDDTYYLYFYQDYNGFPVMHNMYSGQGYEDGEAATVMFNSSGVIGANIMGCYQWEQDEEVSILSINEAADTVFENYQGIVNTSYQINHISLMMDIIPGENYTAKLRPVWVFDTEVFGDEYSYQSNIIIDAVNGEELTE